LSRAEIIEYKWTVLTVTTVGVLVAGLNSRIVIVGIPQVAVALNADAEQAIWFTQAYLLGIATTLLLIGRLTDIFGRVKIYTTGFAIFTLGSLIAGFSQTPDEVIVFRSIQGLGAAMLFTNSAAMITDATPVQQLGMALGINQVAFRFGAMIGLTFSGIVLSILGWRGLFFVSVPIGIFGTLWARKQLKEIGTVEKHAPIDWYGFVLFSVSITSFLLALTFAAYGFESASLVEMLLLVSLLSFSLFIIHVRRSPSPLLDFTLLRIREFAGGVVAQLINAVAWEQCSFF
jgi:MFS family permease